MGKGDIQKQNLEKLKQMDVVSEIEWNEFKSSYWKDVTDAVDTYYKQTYNWTVTREWFGDVYLTKSGIKSSYNHSKSQEKIAAYMSVPDIIKNWELTNIIPNRKNRNYDTYVFSAPILIWGKRYIWVVSVNRPTGTNNNYYYLHHVEVEEMF